MTGLPAFVEIVSPPDGEAPLWVREQWVGLRLPIAIREAEPLRIRTFGVLTAPRTAIGRFLAVLRGKTASETGFVVPVIAAMELLGQSSPEAARWWREHAAHLVRSDRYFLFDEKCGRACQND